MKTRFPAASTGRTCARCGRPSTLSSSTASTFLQSSSIDPTSSTFHFVCNSLVKRSILVALDSTSGLPPRYAATTRAPGTWLGLDGSLSNAVKAVTCEVSSPIIPILIGVNLLTFALFFMVNTPDDMARMQLGVKRVTPEAIDDWKRERGYDRPLFVQVAAEGRARVTDTIFFDKSVRLFAFDFGFSDDGRDIGREIRERMGPSLAIALPVFVLGLFAYVCAALLLVFFRQTPLDLAGVIACVVLMSVSAMFYIIGGQYLVSKAWRLAPISGFADGVAMVPFLLLPVVIGVVAGIGSSTRWYRTIFLDEMGREYVRTARAKGLSELRVLSGHVLRNAMIPILTGVVVVIPSLFLGSLLFESFFGIPGLGSYTIDAINAQDFAAVRAMVFLGSVLYIVGLVLTDLSYAWVDPRVRLA